MSHKRFTVTHTDKGQMTSQGFLLNDAHLTRTGVFKYRKADGSIIRELRHPDDVFNEDSLNTLRMAPVTNDHPTEFVTPENLKEHTVGWISDSVTQNDHLLSAKVVLADKKAISDYQLGKKELSAGYHADLIDESGEYNGEQYDVRQKNIRYNHIALVKAGRAGPQVRLLDSADEEIVDDKKTEVPKMEKITIDGKEFEVHADAATAFNSFAKKMQDAASTQMEDAKGKMSKAEKEKEEDKAKVDSLQAKIDHLEAEKKERTDANSDDKVKGLVKARLKIEKIAGSVLGNEAKIDDKTDLEIMKEVVLKQSPKAELEGKSDLYVQTRFDAISEDLEGLEERRKSLGATITQKDERKDSEFNANDARKRSLEADKELYKQPLSVSKK